MTDANQMGRVKEIVESVLRSRFKDIDFSVIDIRPDVDEDGQRVLYVKIGFDSKTKFLDAGETSGLLRRILPKMEETGEHGFPILSFIAKSELGKMSSDAA